MPFSQTTRRPRTALVAMRGRRPAVPAVPAVTAPILLLLAAVLLAGCGGPRELRYNPGKPEFPAPLFTDELPRPELIGLSTQRLEQRRALLVQVESGRPDQEEYLEYFSNHPYLLAVHYHVDSLDGRVVRMEYELIPQIHTDIGLRLALLGELVAGLGKPEREYGGTVEWGFAKWRVRWTGPRLEVRRPEGEGQQ
ncbi:MAG: hypothetical protein AB7S36_02930 [Planctomycetota bacterium]